MKQQSFDIRAYKHRLRAHYKKIRTAMSPAEKKTCDTRLYHRLIHLPEYKRCKILLCFVSTDIEVDTHRLIQHALSAGKIVAVPFCIPGTRRMDFYRIHSIDDLETGTFGVLEPNPETCDCIQNFEHAICVLPGLAFDHGGFRLGYGGGYYDRFLSAHFQDVHCVTVGICYAGCVTHKLPRGKFDIPCRILVTERYIRRKFYACPQ